MSDKPTKEDKNETAKARAKFDDLKFVLTRLREDHFVQSDAVTLAIEAIVKAASATMKYSNELADLETPEQRKAFEKGKPDELAELWNTAALAVGSIDPDLRKHCFVKAHGWTLNWKTNQAFLEAASTSKEMLEKALALKIVEVREPKRSRLLVFLRDEHNRGAVGLLLGLTGPNVHIWAL